MQGSILIVDDDVDVLASIKLILETEDYKVYTACDGAQAKVFLTENDIQVVIMDYILPEQTGDQIVRELKKIDDSFSVIFLSGWPQVIKAVEELEYDVYRVFLKPVDPEILLSAIRSISGEYVDDYHCLDAHQIVTELSSSH